MATRQSMEDFLQKCEDAIRYAQDQYRESSLQEQYNNVGYTDALQQLEERYNELCDLAHSANAQQRDQLHRMRLQLQQVQNNMILH
ncbi:YtzC family protein [Neobacillus terrae]|uniref:YtzC family protein n=1 Tax=Neobacillus terrae TaxID=3034837 RepID=UPI00140804B6|nr:YtzC family protein [Neobacillus terrae]NHM33118.1 YtzC family protein [Neobacillus terrae]